MRLVTWLAAATLFVPAAGHAQERFTITGTAIPANVLVQNYGRIPKGVGAYDLNVCNVSGSKQAIVSSEIFQALSLNNPSLAPLGRQVILAAVLNGQNHSKGNVAKLSFSAATGVLSILDASRYHLPPVLNTVAALGSVAGQVLLSNFGPLLNSNQVEKFERDVLESALMLDSGSCVERTIFAVSVVGSKPTSSSLTFHIR